MMAAEVAGILGINRRRDGDLARDGACTECGAGLTLRKTSSDWPQPSGHWPTGTSIKWSAIVVGQGAHDDGTAAHSRLCQADSVNPVA